MNNNSFMSICKKDMFHDNMGSIFIKDKTYKCNYFGTIGITVIEENGGSYTFRHEVFNDFFYTKQELRKYKLKKLSDYESNV